MYAVPAKASSILGDVNAVQKGKVGRRVARRVAGKATGRVFSRLFKVQVSGQEDGTGRGACAQPTFKT